MGWHGQDTSELFFEEVKLPASALLGGEANRGFYQMMEQLPQERLLVGVQALGLVEAALRETIAYTKDRKAFGKTVFDFQNTKFQLAESATEAKICRVFLDDCVDKLVRGELDATTAAMAKYWLSERASKIIDSCVQLFGGYGFMAEYPVGVMWTDVRVMRIYAGTNEIMKELISRTL